MTAECRQSNALVFSRSYLGWHLCAGEYRIDWAKVLRKELGPFKRFCKVLSVRFANRQKYRPKQCQMQFALTKSGAVKPSPKAPASI